MSFLHDATPTWNGFNYQGKIGLLVVLDKIRELLVAGETIDGYFVELEWFEDFSIKYNEEYISIHQVKNYGERGLENYGAAIQSLLSKGVGFITPFELMPCITQKKINKSVKLDYSTRIFEYIKLKGLISVNQILNCNFSQIESLLLPPDINVLFKKPEAVLSRLKDILKHHLTLNSNCHILESCYLHTAEELEDDFSVENIKALTSITESGISSISNFNILINKLKLYTYNTGIYNCKNNEIQDLLDGRIKELLQFRHSISDVNDYKIQFDYISKVRRRLLGIIDENVNERHEAIRIGSNSAIKCISFNEFLEVISNDCQISHHFDLYILKEVYTNALEDFLDENLDKDEVCQFLQKVSAYHLKKYPGLDFINFCKAISPQIQTSQITLLESSGLRNSFFEYFKLCLKGKNIVVKDTDAIMNTITTIHESNFDQQKELSLYKRIYLNSNRLSPNSFNIESYAGAIGSGKGGKYYNEIISRETKVSKQNVNLSSENKYTKKENFKIVDIVDLNSRLA